MGAALLTKRLRDSRENVSYPLDPGFGDVDNLLDNLMLAKAQNWGMDDLLLLAGYVVVHIAANLNDTPVSLVDVCDVVIEADALVDRSMDNLQPGRASRCPCHRWRCHLAPTPWL